MIEQIKILENDIRELANTIQKERVHKKAIEVPCTGLAVARIYRTEDIDDKDYNDYKKLIDTFIQNLTTYCKLTRSNSFKYEDFKDVYDCFENWIQEEIENVHELMVKSQKIDNYGQYRCLNYVYNKLLNELNDMEGIKPRPMMTIEGNMCEHYHFNDNNIDEIAKK